MVFSHFLCQTFVFNLLATQFMSKWHGAYDRYVYILGIFDTFFYIGLLKWCLKIKKTVEFFESHGILGTFGVLWPVHSTGKLLQSSLQVLYKNATKQLFQAPTSQLEPQFKPDATINYHCCKICDVPIPLNLVYYQKWPFISPLEPLEKIYGL